MSASALLDFLATSPDPKARAAAKRVGKENRAAKAAMQKRLDRATTVAKPKP